MANMQTFLKLRLVLMLFSLLGVYACQASTQSPDKAPKSASSCQSNRVKLQMLGVRGPEIMDRQASTSYLIWLDNKARVIIDQGPGSLQRFEQSKARYEDIQLMLFTHFHVDHSSDFPAYIKGGFFSKRDQDLPVIGPSGTRFIASASQFVDRMIGFKSGAYPYLGVFLDPKEQSSYKIKVTTIPWSYSDLSIKKIFDQHRITVKSVPVHHGPFPALGYRVELAGCSISFTGDMSGRLGAMPDLAMDSDILVAHNAIPEDAVGAPALLHMKPSYIGKLAKHARVKKLLLTHLMKRTIKIKPETRRLIREHYQGKLAFPKDLDIFHP